MMLMMPNVISNESRVVTIKREFSANHIRMPVCTWKVKSGTFVGVDRTQEIVIAPQMIPTTNAATIIIL